MGQNSPAGFVAIDANGDGHLDLVAVSVLNSTVLAYLGNGSGGFIAGTPTALPPVSLPFGRSITGEGDVDGDGLVDVVTHNASASEVTRPLFSLGTGQFAAGPSILVGPGQSRFGFVGDLDGDGIAEVAVTGSYSSPIGTGCTGTAGTGGGVIEVRKFDPTTQAMVIALTLNLPGALAHKVIGGDFDGDGWSDLAVQTCSGLGTTYNYDLTLYRQVMGPAPSTAGPWPVVAGLLANSPTGQRAVGDFDGDGLDDLCFVFDGASPGQYDVQFFAGDASTGFDPPVVLTYSGGVAVSIGYNNESYVPIGDFDGDGVVDLLCRTLVVRPGNPASTVGMAAVTNWTVPPGGAPGFPVASGDFDGDGDADVVLSQTTNAGQLNQSMTLYFVRSAGRFHTPCTAPGVYPALGIGTPFLGNAGFYLSLTGAPPGAAYAFGVATQPATNFVGGCTLWLSTAAADLVLPTADVGFGVADASGSAVLPVALPGLPSFLFATAYAQAVVFDPAGAFVVGGFTLSLSDARRIVVW